MDGEDLDEKEDDMRDGSLARRRDYLTAFAYLRLLSFAPGGGASQR